MSDQPNPRWTSAELTAVLGVLFTGIVSVIIAIRGEARNGTLSTIETNTNSKLTEQNAMLKELRDQVQLLKIERATAQERQNPTEADGSAK